MSIKKFEKIEDFEEFNKFFLDFYNNLGIDDLRPSGLGTAVPTASTMNKGKFRLVEISDVPSLYYRTLAGTVYLLNSGQNVVDATYLTLSANALLSNERVLTAGTNITFVDGGAGSTLTINGAGGAPTDATYLVLSSNSTLTAERVLTAGTNITFVDSGANGTLTISSTGGSPAGSDTQIQFNDAGAFGADSDFTWNKTTNILTTAGDHAFTSDSTPTARNIYTTDQTTLNKAASKLSIRSGAGNGSGAGGVLFLGSGTGGATGTGGALNINGGNGGSTSGNGGAINIESGDGNASGKTGNGGNINLNAGDSALSGNGGDINLTPGNAAGTNKTGGSVNFSLGSNTGSGTGGTFWIDRTNQTGLTVEQIASKFNTFTMGLADGTTIASQRTWQFLAPTINGVAGGSTETVTTATTVYIDAAPSGSNITITNPYALWIDSGTSRFDGNLDFSPADATNIVLGTSTGTKIGTATSQKLGFFNKTPIVQQTTTSQTAATFVANTSLTADDSATWDGYTIGDIVAILRAFGLFA